MHQQQAAQRRVSSSNDVVRAMGAVSRRSSWACVDEALIHQDEQVGSIPPGCGKHKMHPKYSAVFQG